MKYVDTDVFLYWATDDPQHGARATQILRGIETNEKAVTSVLTFWVFNNLMKAHPSYALTTFLEHVQQIRNLRIAPLDDETLAKADELSRGKSVSLAVAVAATVAQEKGCDGVYSLNPEFDKTALRREF